MTGCDIFDEAIKKFGVDNACEYFGVKENTKLWYIFDSLRGVSRCEKDYACLQSMDTFCEYCESYKGEK